MFHDLDSTLKELLTRGLPPWIVSEVNITFATPDTGFPPASVKLPAIDLFLYEVHENRELRSHEADVERMVNGRAVRTPAPARIDCHYLVTTWSAAAQDPWSDEHRLLGEVMRVLLRHKEIPREALRGSLEAQPFPVRARVSPPSQQQSHGDFWQALGRKPKAVVHYTVTISMDTGEPEDAGRVALTSGG